MNISEINLNISNSLFVHGKRIATVEQRDCDGRTDCLLVHFENGPDTRLTASVDVSEQIDYPRVFCIEASLAGLMALFGGERMYWLSADGIVKGEFQTFREWEFSEYWTTEMVESDSNLVIIYEAGVLLVDDGLHVKWHSRKYFNDIFSGMEGHRLQFVRDHECQWFMSLQDGTGFLV